MFKKLKNSNAAPILKKYYRQFSGNLLSLAVKSQLIGELPQLASQTNSKRANDVSPTVTSTPSAADTPTVSALANQPTILTFYVLKEYSRSNSILIDLETQTHQLPPALAPVTDPVHGIDEHSAMVFLSRPQGSRWQRTAEKRAYPSRLARLIQAVQTYPDLNIEFVPVTILWGRAPEKEDSILNLLTADDWQVPSIPKQLFNIGVKGRDTYVQFHAVKDLRHILAEERQRAEQQKAEQQRLTISPSGTTGLITQSQALESLAPLVQQRLNAYLDKQQETILGPDLSDRRNVVDTILFTPAIQHAITQDSKENHRAIAESRQLARQYLNEITSDYTYSIIRFFDRFLTWLWTQLYDGVKVQHFERVREVAGDYEIVYVPCHRSHMDYLLLSYVIYKRGLRIPYVAAGDNLNIPVLGQILRRGGAFFMRRTFKGNALYAAVFREYMHNILSRNTPIEYFIEGGRSRSGRLLPPKKGMLAMTVESHLRKSSKPIVFIPTYIGYERIMEGGTYIGELSGKPKESESLLGLLKATRKIERIFGNVHVSFGQPLYLSDFMQKFEVAPNSLPADRSDNEMPANVTHMIDNLAVKIMQRINRTAVINPVSLLSLVLLSTPKAAIDEQSCGELLALYQRLAQALPYDPDVTITADSAQTIINYGIKLKLIERTPQVLGDIIRVAQNQAPLLSYFRNNILHVYILSSLLACVIQRNGSMSLPNLERLVLVMYPFLQAELFLKYPMRSLSETIEHHLDVLIQEKLIVEKTTNEQGIRLFAAPEPNTRHYQQLSVLSNSVEHSLERYFMVLALLSQHGSGRLTKEQVIDLCHLLGQRLAVLYEENSPDFFDRSLFSSFIDALQRLEYINVKNNLIYFDNRIDNMAQNSRYILDLDVLHILQQLAHLNDEEIERTLTELQNKKQRLFGRKKS